MKLDNWFTAIVTNLADPLNAGRVQIRCYEYHTTDEELLGDQDLPWAMPLLPVTSASSSGTGTSATGLLVGSWVFGFFRDTDNQDPVIIGSIPGIDSLNGLGIPDIATSRSTGVTATAGYITDAPIAGEAPTSALNNDTVPPDTIVYSGNERGGNIIEIPGTIRREPLGEPLKAAISRALVGTGLNWKSISGGQMAEADVLRAGGDGYYLNGRQVRIGTTTHDLDPPGGNGIAKATDGKFIDAKTGRTLNADNAEDRARISRAISRLVRAGIRGIGWDTGGRYMGPETFHLDIKKPTLLIWGAGGSGQSPEYKQRAAWLISAASAKSGEVDLNSTGEYIEESQSEDIQSNSKYANNLVRVARGEIGNKNGSKYGSQTLDWDESFVGWCIGKIGIPVQDLPKDKSTTQGYRDWANGAGKKYIKNVGDNRFLPGDIIIAGSKMAIITVGSSRRSSGYSFIQGASGRGGVYEYKNIPKNTYSWRTVLRWIDDK
jgi:hypothetical protein